MNVLLRTELAAVQVYQHALRSLDGRLGGDTARIAGFAVGHQRTVAVLQGCVRALGGVPDAEPAASWSPYTLFGDEQSVRQLLAAERNTLADYEEALGALDGEARDLVEQELIPRQLHHVATLARILEDLPPDEA